MENITVVESNDITRFPPVQNLLRILLSTGYYVYFIGYNVEGLPNDLKNRKNLECFEIRNTGNSAYFVGKIVVRLRQRRKIRRYLAHCMKNSKLLWTTSMNTMRDIGRKALDYKNILQLMELAQHGYIYHKSFRFPIDKYARKSWKTVVPEINRAYIQKVWWDLEKTPYVLPNKPFDINPGPLTMAADGAIQKMKQEKRRIVLYLGGIYTDRNFESFANAIDKMEGYVLYIVGKAFSPAGEKILQDLSTKIHIVYLGAFDPPTHLAVIQYAHIGLLPYKPEKGGIFSELNALYCAPNKIWEYAGFGVPMVGSDVLGLKLPFEQWNIGRCCDLNDEVAIIKAIEEVDRNHDEMSKNCYKFYDSVDLEKIVSEILEEEN